MAQNKEQLNKLLQFIKQLIDEPGNDDFVNGLRGLLEISGKSLNNETKLLDIEKYLGLDYKLDNVIPNIDYSFISEPYVKNQLDSDFREMLRYRYGVRSHKIDFSEYCRFAMLQVEQLLNYYYQNKFTSNEELFDYINQNAPWFKTEKVDSVKSLSLSVKLSAFSTKLEKKLRDCLDFTREVRNEQSHRNPDEKKNEMNEFRTKLLNMELPLTKEGEIYWSGIKDNDELFEKFNSIKSEYWRYRYQLWRFKEPFDNVFEAIHEIANVIKSDIKKRIINHG